MKLMQTKIGEVCYAGSEDIQRQVANNPPRGRMPRFLREKLHLLFFLIKFTSRYKNFIRQILT